MPQKDRSEQWSEEGDAAQANLSSNLSAQGSDTEFPPVTKAGLGEGDQGGLADEGGSDTDVKDGTKTGLGED